MQRPKLPEERELEKKQTELVALETSLAQRELELATLKAHLRGFEARYLEVVGSRFAQLDEIEAEIAESRARRSPDDLEANERARNARSQATESAHTTRLPPDRRPALGFAPSHRLKQLYRAAAKEIHPDLAEDDEERALRHQVMTDVNRAYEHNDEVALELILQDWASRPEALRGEGPAVELVRVIRTIARVELRLTAIQVEMTDLMATDLYRLWTQADQEAREHHDLLAQLAREVEMRIRAARDRADAARAT